MSVDHELVEVMEALVDAVRTLTRQVGELKAAIILLQTTAPAEPLFSNAGVASLRLLRDDWAEQERAMVRAQVRGALHGARDRCAKRPLGPEEPDGSYLAGYCDALAHAGPTEER